MACRRRCTTARPSTTRKRAGSNREQGSGSGLARPCPHMATDIEKAPEALQQLVADTDTGGRNPTGVTARILFAVSLIWALFQLWYASPLPFALGFGILNDTEARALHLGLALFLAFTAWPAFKRSPRKYVPVVDWVLALVAAFAGAYLLLFYKELATRPGQPTQADIVVACA